MRTFVVVVVCTCLGNTLFFAGRLVLGLQYIPASEHLQNFESLLLACIGLWGAYALWG